MLRPLVAATAAVLLLAGCGDDSPAPSGPSPFSGTIFGQPFTPAEGSGLTLSETTCTIEGTTGSGTGLAIRFGNGFGSVPGLCPFVQSNGVCANKANATTVDLLVARANLSGGTAGPVQPGTYTISAIPSTDGQGNVILATARITKTGAAPDCGTPTATFDATSGTIRIDAIGSHIVGSASLTFPSGGGTLSGSFDVPTCALAVDVCSALSCTTPATCVP